MSSSDLRCSVSIAPDLIDRAPFGSRHEPRAGVARDALFRPLREGRNEGILRKILGASDVAQHPRQPCDQLGRFDAPDCRDASVKVGRHSGGG